MHIMHPAEEEIGALFALEAILFPAGILSSANGGLKNLLHHLQTKLKRTGPQSGPLYCG